MDGWRQSLPGFILGTLQGSTCSNEEQPDFFYFNTLGLLCADSQSPGNTIRNTHFQEMKVYSYQHRAMQEKKLKTNPRSSKSTAPQCPASFRLQQFCSKAKGQCKHTHLKPLILNPVRISTLPVSKGADLAAPKLLELYGSGKGQEP